MILALRVTMPSNSALASGAGLRRVPGAGANGEGRTVSAMQRYAASSRGAVRGDGTETGERAEGTSTVASELSEGAEERNNWK
jgi:hypothetical protein